MAFWKDEARDAAPAGAAPAPGAGEEEVVLGSGVELDGKLTFAGSVRIDARFKGSISADGLVVVGDRARVEADIACGAVIVHGAVDGSIRARRSVEILPHATVRGEVEAPSLSVEKGAVLEGRSRVPGASPDAARSGAEAAAPLHA